MPEIDARIQIAAARRNVSLRRRQWRFMGVGVLCFAAVFIPLMLLGSRLDGTVRVVVFAPLVLAFLVCRIGSVLTIGEIYSFTCSRCGQLFGASHYGGTGHDHCKHCGLSLSPAVATAT